MSNPTPQQIKSMDKRMRATAIVMSLVLIGLVIYGIKSQRKFGYYLLSVLVLAPAAGWLTAAVSGPLVAVNEEEEPTKTGE